MKRILVTGATRRTGRHIVSQLAAGGSEVCALVRNPHEAHLPADVEIVRGDLTAPETLDPHLDGIDAVFLVWTAPPDTVPAVIDRIAKRVRRIVFLSSPYTVAHPMFQAPQPNPISSLHAAIEQRIRSSGLAWTFLRPGMFAANALWWWAPQIRAGDVVRWPYAMSACAPIDERDIAAVAVRALCDEHCGGAEYILTGPESLTHADQVSAIGEALGRCLRYEEISPEALVRDLPAHVRSSPDGAQRPPEWRAVRASYEHLLRAWEAAIDPPALVTSTVEEVTGAPPRTFREWAADNISGFQAGRAAN